MKQKRKVKSLISSKSDSSVLLSALLFLVGGILVFGAVALFTSSVGVASAQGEGEAFEYENGIEDKVEVLLNLKFASDGLSNTVNEMYFSGNTFYMKGNDGISRDVPAGGSIDGYVNYLGGEWDGMIISSDNVTIIGGKSVKVFENNANTTILGGLNNTVNERNTAGSVAPVMLGGQNNTIGENQLGSAIVGGNHNTISNNGSYDFILGGENNTINGENVIVGGSKVTVNGKSNVFVFNDGETTFTPQGSNTFYLYLKNGLGLNKAAVNKGVDSKGSVSFGSISIGMLCEDEDVGVQGRWEGCLVGCTYRSATNGKKWEMIDHGDTCEEKCKDNPTRCMVDPIEPTPPADYTSECTVGGVDTNHSTQCAANRLNVYENVMFETFLIDSDDDCANYDTHQNKCIFKCDKDYHLTGNIAGGSSATKKCYKDCTLPWNGEKIKHNVKVDAYNAKTVACSNTEWVFPLTTAIVNVPNTSEYTLGLTINGMVKARVGNGAKEGHSYESCTNYSHKKTLVCYDGELYIANTNGTKTNTKALGNTGAWYGYDVCTTKDYKCPTSVYNLTQSYITTNSIAKDTVTRNNTDRSTSMGTRGQYKLCLDWTPSVGNSECKVGRNGANGTPADSYHYQLVKCNTHYSTGTDNNPYECKKSCSIKNLAGNVTRTDNNGREYKHNTVITGYKLNSELCTALGNGTCHAASIICDDGVWKMGSKAGPENTEYLYNDCKLNAYVCNSRFDISQANKNSWQSSYPHSVYEACTPYDPSGRFLCVAKQDKFDLINCNGSYHTENNKYCISNSKTISCTNKPSNSTYYIGYNSYAWNGTWNAGSWVHTYGHCDWYCNNGYHLKGAGCSSNTETYACYKPANSHWGTSTEVWEWFGTWDSGEMKKVQDCEWFCDDRYERVGDECVYVPEGCSSPACGSLEDGDSCTTYERCSNTEVISTCTDGNWDVPPTSYTSSYEECSSCTGCPGRTYVGDGGTCTSYDQCSSTQISSTCNDGSWNTTPGDYSSPNMGCSEGCDAIGVCPATADGGTCKTYATCSATSKTITCNNGTWDGTPYDYLSANQGCASCEGCPSGTVAHNGTCTSYSTNSSCECGSYQRVSICNNGTWSSTPYTYGSCSAPVICGEPCTICGATVTAGNSRTCWNYSSPTSPTMCDSEVRRCENGTPTGTYSYSSCTQKYRPCTGCPGKTSVAHDGTCESYAECSSTKITSTCTDGSWNTAPGAYSSANQNCSYSCQGSAPSNATLVAGSDQNLSSNVDRTLYANSTAAAGKKCAYLCNLSDKYYYNSSAQQCLYKDEWCNENVVNGCLSPSSATNKNSSNASKYTWDCAIDGTTMEAGCYKCKDGYTDKGNGVCEPVDSCAGYTLTKCPDHGVCSNCPSDSSKKKLDSCMPTSCTAYCATCPSSDWLGACPANADCQVCETYIKNGNECNVNNTSYRFLNCKTGFQPKDAAHPYDCVSSSPVCNINMTTACDAQVKPSGNGLCDVGSASVATSTYDPLSNYPIWVWSCTQGGTTVGGYYDGCWCRRPWAEFWIAGYGSMGLQNEQNQAWYFDIGMSVSDSFSSNVPIGIGVEYTCNNAFGGNSGTETFYDYMNNNNNGNGLTITLPCVPGAGGYQNCECSVSRARIASMPEIVQLSHGNYVAIY